MELSDITEELGRLRGITETLQAQNTRPKSRMDKFKDSAGVLSLFISLVISAFTIWHNLITDPANALAEREIKLQTILAQITSLDEDATRMISQPGGNPNNTISFVEVRRNILLQQAENYAKSGATSSDEYRLANLFEFGGLYKKALDHYRTAQNLTGKNSDDDVLVKIKLAQYDYYGLGGNLYDGRRLFKNLEGTIGNNPFGSVESSEKFTYILQNEAMMECVKGDPESSSKALEQLNNAYISMLTQQPLTFNWVSQNRKSTGMTLVNSQCKTNAIVPLLVGGASTSGQTSSPARLSSDVQGVSSSSTTTSLSELGTLSGIDSPALDLESLKTVIAYARTNRLGDLRTVGPDTKSDAKEWPAKISLPLATHCVVFSSEPPEQPMNFYECYARPFDLAEAEKMKARFVADVRLIPGSIPGNPSPDDREIRFTTASGVHVTIRGTNDFSVKKSVSMFIFPPQATGY